MQTSSNLWRRLMVVAVVAALATATLAALIRLNKKPTSPPEETASSTGQLTTTTAPPYAYLGTWEGRLAVFRSTGASPDEVYDVFVASLPETEQQALEERIPVHDELELQGLLEDYTG